MIQRLDKPWNKTKIVSIFLPLHWHMVCLSVCLCGIVVVEGFTQLLTITLVQPNVELDQRGVWFSNLHQV